MMHGRVIIAYFEVRQFMILHDKILNFVNMESLVIHPDSVEQLKTIKAVLKALKVPFEPQSNTLPPHITESIERGVKQYGMGQTISLEEFKEKHFSKK